MPVFVGAVLVMSTLVIDRLSPLVSKALNDSTAVDAAYTGGVPTAVVVQANGNVVLPKPNAPVPFVPVPLYVPFENPTKQRRSFCYQLKARS
jgi:hypothetical protein